MGGNVCSNDKRDENHPWGDRKEVVNGVGTQHARSFAFGALSLLENAALFPLNCAHAAAARRSGKRDA